MHGRGMPERVRGEVLAGQRRTGFCCGLLIPGDPGVDRVPGHRGSPAGDEQRAAVIAGLPGEPGAERCDGLGVERRAPFLPALACALDMRSGAQADVRAGEPGELGHAQPGADRGEHEGVVAAPGPGLPVRGGQQGVGFVVGEPADDRRVRPAGLDGQDALDDGRVVRCPQRRVTEQRADRGQPGVTGGRAAAAAGFQPAQEIGDQAGVELPDVQFPCRGAGGVLREGQQQPPGVPC